ncbi:MAG: DUF362 domain-containing protein [Candidatus Lokiarchaeota archaeon]|nr:DUF362 domain-containing protein [Candidatus Lokiarchaeota archaeon]MBD3199065.1 DUF362 domain-containing protein [Candidatus Lokiarchaeota archaeon]
MFQIRVEKMDEKKNNTKGKKTSVAIVDISEHENVEEAVAHGINLIKPRLSFNFNSSNQILLKPNLLIAKENACTQPSFVAGVISFLKNEGVSMKNVLIGDSPGQFKKNATEIAKKIGLFEICDSEGIKFVNFDDEVPSSEIIPNGKRINEYYVSKPIKDCDIIINLPKLKTHGEASMTGAVKNYWGIIPGGLKAKLHLKGKSPDEFGECIADNYSWISNNKPNRITIYDLDCVMQGTMGPVSGKMVDWNLLLVGTDELALDTIALAIGKFKGRYIPHLKQLRERDIGVGDIEDIEIFGISLEEAKRKTPKFKIPGSRMVKLSSYITSRIIYRVTKKVPRLNAEKCIKCGECAKNCPANAIESEKGEYPHFQRKNCISCLCCAELCIRQAINTKRRGIGGLFHSF